MAADKNPKANTGSDESGEPDYEVGYRKPPKQTRFQPRQSGNPKGRPPKSRQPKEQTIDVTELLNEPVTVQHQGQSREMQPFEVSLRALVKQALHDKDLKAIQEFLNYCDKYDVSPAKPVSEVDGGVLVLPKGMSMEEFERQCEEYRAANPPDEDE